MLRKSPFRRASVVSLQGLLLLYVLGASVPSLVIPECCEHTRHLTLDGVVVAWLAACLQLLTLLARRPGPLTVGSVWSLGRSLVIHHVKYGIVGGYVFGVTHAFVHCLLK